MKTKLTHRNGQPMHETAEIGSASRADGLTAVEQANLAWLADEYPVRDWVDDMNRLRLIRYLYRRGVINEWRLP